MHSHCCWHSSSSAVRQQHSSTALVPRCSLLPHLTQTNPTLELAHEADPSCAGTTAGTKQVHQTTIHRSTNQGWSKQHHSLGCNLHVHLRWHGQAVDHAGTHGTGQLHYHLASTDHNWTTFKGTESITTATTLGLNVTLERRSSAPQFHICIPQQFGHSRHTKLAFGITNAVRISAVQAQPWPQR